MEVVEEDIGFGQLFGSLFLVVIVWVPCDVGIQHLVGCCVGSKDGFELHDGLEFELGVGHLDDNRVVEEWW